MFALQYIAAHTYVLDLIYTEYTEYTDWIDAPYDSEVTRS